MDKKTVFIKTKEGEEAMRQRTRLVQRNLRNILIMVDGHAAVADLAKRFGDEATTEAALRDLLAGGFIAEQAGQLDFTTTPLPEAQPAEDVPVLSTPVADVAQPPAPEPVIEEINLIAPEYESLPPPPARPTATPAATDRSWMDKLKARFAAKAEKPAAPAKKAKPAAEEEIEEDVSGADLSPIRRGSRLGLPLLALSAVAGIAVLALLTLLLYPYGRHLPDIERNASAMLQGPVKVGDIGFSFLPRPHIALRNIAVGQEGNLTIASARAVPDFLSLLGERKVFHELAFHGVAVKEAALGKLALAAGASPPVQIRRIAIDGLSLSAGDVRLDAISGEATMSPAGAVEAILLHDRDNTLKVELKPKGEAYLLSASGSNWKPSFKPNLAFQSIDAQGELRAGRLDLAKLDARAYDGLIVGKASLDWAGGANFSGDMEIRHMNAAKLLTALGSDLSAEGELAARLKLSAKADSLDKLAETLRAEGSFEMKRGVARGLDLGEAVRNAGRGPTRGGETKFEQLGGTIEHDPQGSRLGNLRLSSGLLSAGGNLGIARSGPLSGALNVELKSSAATLRVALAVGGTGKDPMLAPGRR